MEQGGIKSGCKAALLRAAGPWHCSEAGPRHNRELSYGPGLIQPGTSFPPGPSAACTKEETPLCVQELLGFSPHRAAGQEQPLHTHGTRAQGVFVSPPPHCTMQPNLAPLALLCWLCLALITASLVCRGEMELGPSHATRPSLGNVTGFRSLNTKNLVQLQLHKTQKLVTSL